MGIDLRLLSTGEIWQEFNELAEMSADFKSAQDSFALSNILLILDNQAIVLKSDALANDKKKELSLFKVRQKLLRNLQAIIHPYGDSLPLTPKTTSAQCRLITFFALGVLVAVCEGFDSMVSMLSIFSLPALTLIIVGIVFSCLSMLAFFILNQQRIVEAFDVQFGAAHQVLECYLQQAAEIKYLRKKINLLSMDSFQDESSILALINSMDIRHRQLMNFGADLAKIAQDKQVIALKWMTAGITALIFFGGSFCTGQTLSIYILSLFVANLNPLSAPVLIFSILVGLSAMYLYWHRDFPSITNFLSIWLGVDEKKMAQIEDQASLNKEGEAIHTLSNNFHSFFSLKRSSQIAQDVELNSYNDVAIGTT